MEILTALFPEQNSAARLHRKHSYVADLYRPVYRTLWDPGTRQLFGELGPTGTAHFQMLGPQFMIKVRPLAIID